MNSFRFIIGAALLLLPLFTLAQSAPVVIQGQVYMLDDQGKEVPAPFAEVFLPETGQGTLTDSLGKFRMESAGHHFNLVARVAGLRPDSLHWMPGSPEPRFLVGRGRQLSEVQITGRAKATTLDRANPVQTQMMGIRELGKAACCNLGESFEANPSVDVSISDGATGAKQLQMLGLAGSYVQILTENVPLMSGLGRTYGLNYIPGPWVQSIQVSKGVGSVVQGYESISGQINVTMKKPDFERLHLNMYANNTGRYEANLNLAQKLSDKWSTVLMTHGSTQADVMDNNGDGFADMAAPKILTVANHWQYRLPSGFQGEFGAQVLDEDRRAGQMMYVMDGMPSMPGHAYGIRIRTQRLEAFSKNGYVWPAKPYQSIGLQLGTTLHNQAGVYGIREYDGRQRRGYANLIFQSIFSNTNHQWRAGLSYVYDQYRERFDLTQLQRQESVPGAFFEYTWTEGDKFTLMAGLRYDQHNLYGGFFTPRLHIRYAPNDLTTFRIAGGRGLRVANLFADNPNILASARLISVAPGLRPEVAWNYGFNVTQLFRLFRRYGTLTLDAYRSDFENQVIVDMDSDPNAVAFYNLNGRSFAHAVQVGAEYELLHRLDLRLAYKFYDVRSTIGGEVRQRPLTAQHRGLVNLAYELSRWKFDATMHWYGPQRLPETLNNPVEYRVRAQAPSYTVFNAQVTHVFSKKFELYVGVENLTDFRQLDPLVAASDPYGPYFDSSLVWGPVMGRVVYVGFRFMIPGPAASN